MAVYSLNTRTNMIPIRALAPILTSLLLAGSALQAADSAVEQRKLLAEHETIARLEEVQYRKCLGLTALCPDQCGHSGEFARFKILKYTRFQQHGKYGERETSFAIQVSDFSKKPKGDPAILAAVATLAPGDHVRLWWRHEYVTRNGASGPERPVVKIEKLDSRTAAELLR